jgi:hypothetical protein
MKAELLVIVDEYATVNILRILYILPVTLWEGVLNRDESVFICLSAYKNPIFEVGASNRSEVITR